MTVDKSQSPYLDDYDPNKNYTQVLAVPGRVEQAREFTQAQTIMHDYLRRLSDTLFKDGAIISGMGFVIKDTTILIEQGRIYIQGRIYNFYEQEIPFSKTGTEIVGVELVETIVTEEEDTSLLDGTTSTGNYGSPGAHRIKATVVAKVNDSNCSPIYKFVDGMLQHEAQKPHFDGIQDALARRTYDESGNYRVSGLELITEPHDANHIRVVAEAGRAYVEGYQIVKPAPVKKVVPMSKNTRTVTSEPKVFTTGTTEYQLNNYPSKDISQVTAYVEVTQTLTRGATVDGIDYLSNTPVVDIREVTSGTVTYTEGVDYQLSNNGVDWSLGGSEPTAGTSYTVTYWYNKVMDKDVDYRLKQVEDGNYGQTIDYVEFLSDDLPVSNTTFYTTYDFYLSRIDVVSLNKNGDIIVTQGQSDIPRNVKPPVVNNPQLLTLGTVYMPPNSGIGKASFKSVTRLEMREIQRLQSRVHDLEFNQSITALDREAMDGELPTDLRGIFSDSFRSTVRADLAHADFNVMYDLEFGIISLPLANVVPRKLELSTPDTLKTWSRIATIPMTETVSIDQPTATTTMLLNPYLAFNSVGIMSLNPQVDNWIDQSFIELEETQHESRNFWRWWGHTEDAWRFDRNADIMDLQIVEGAPVGTSVSDWRPRWQGANVFPSATAVRTEKSREILEEAITYMRRTEVTIHATNLQPSTDNLELMFDGKRCDLTPLTGYQSGSASGTVRADASGVVKAKFNIPENVRTGTREVVLQNSSNVATSSYTSIGTKRTTVDTVTTTRITMTAIDPLAQTFQFDKNTTLTSVGAYFSAKDTVDNVIVQIRDVVNGYPGTMILAEKVITPDDILISSDATVETKVSFDQPVVCSSGKQYCVAYLTDSAVHTMYVSNLSEDDITTGTKVTSQPYLPGMLFSSSNGLAWTAHQSMNLKFKIYSASFNDSITVDFIEQKDMNADRLLLMADFTAPSGTDCIWQVSINGGTYQPITPHSELNLQEVANTVRVRALLTSSTDLAPLLATDSINLVGFTSALSGSYIGRNVELSQYFSSVKQIFDAHVPEGCAVTPQYSYDNGVTWRTSTVQDTHELSPTFTRFICEDTVPTGTQADNYRARINISTNNELNRPTVRRFANIMK